MSRRDADNPSFLLLTEQLRLRCRALLLFGLPLLEPPPLAEKPLDEACRRPPARHLVDVGIGVELFHLTFLVQLLLHLGVALAERSLVAAELLAPRRVGTLDELLGREQPERTAGRVAPVRRFFL